MCTSCGEKVKVYCIDLQDFDEESYLAHKEYIDSCYEDWKYAYLSEIKRLEKELYDKIDELNKQYLKGNDKLTREIAHKNNTFFRKCQRMRYGQFLSQAYYSRPD